MASTVAKQLYRRVAALPHKLHLARRIFSTAIRSSSSNNSPAASQHSPLAAAEGGNAAKGGTKVVGLEANAGPPTARTIQGSLISWASLGLLVCTGVGLLTYYDRQKRQRIDQSDSKRCRDVH